MWIHGNKSLSQNSVKWGRIPNPVRHAPWPPDARRLPASGCHAGCMALQPNRFSTKRCSPLAGERFTLVFQDIADLSEEKST